MSYQRSDNARWTKNRPETMERYDKLALMRRTVAIAFNLNIKTSKKTKIQTERFAIAELGWTHEDWLRVDQEAKLRMEIAAVIPEKKRFSVAVTPEFEKTFATRRQAEGMAPSKEKRAVTPQRSAPEETLPEDKKPTPMEIAFILEIEQGGMDFCGVKQGTWHRIGNTVRKTRFVIGHLKNRCEFGDGRDHFWLDETTRNYRIVADFVNGIENSVPWSSTRDEDTKQRLAESNIEYNIPEEVVRKLFAESSILEGTTLLLP